MARIKADIKTSEATNLSEKSVADPNTGKPLVTDKGVYLMSKGVHESVYHHPIYGPFKVPND